MRKNNVIAGILAILSVMSVSGCGDKEAESSTVCMSADMIIHINAQNWIKNNKKDRPTANQ